MTDDDRVPLLLRPILAKVPKVPTRATKWKQVSNQFCPIGQYSSWDSTLVLIAFKAKGARAEGRSQLRTESPAHRGGCYLGLEEEAEWGEERVH